MAEDPERMEVLAETAPKQQLNTLSSRELKTELDAVDKLPRQRINEPPFVEEVELPNGHEWKRKPDETWCRFSNNGDCLPGRDGSNPQGQRPRDPSETPQGQRSRDPNETPESPALDDLLQEVPEESRGLYQNLVATDPNKGNRVLNRFGSCEDFESFQRVFNALDHNDLDRLDIVFNDEYINFLSGRMQKRYNLLVRHFTTGELAALRGGIYQRAFRSFRTSSQSEDRNETSLEQLRNE
ncbi:hypothetical protein [Baaleninema simplex]|uniref:hypothetical protein n=1 Tax=Baaleninema simplex TaxID=2862350 RepID=UPI001181A6C3|nr:hypothetical protein [Baaleninema simplex]